MYDTHYDLLTILYVLKDNKEYIEKVIDDLNSNLVGLNANLYFMSKKEMEEELKIKDKIDVSKMFKEALELLKNKKLKQKIILSIEGCDFIKDTKELEYLHSLGLKAILPVWNNENKYGSGIRTNKGLTKEGEKLIEKAIDLGIAIDLSHANENTFYGIINVIKKSEKKVFCYASHSNIYELQNNPRNLKIKELKALKEVGGYLGLVAYPPFITNSKENEKIKEEFLNHISKAEEIMGIDRIMIATDNMEFYKPLNIPYVNSPFTSKTLKKDMESLLERKYEREDIDKIMYKNAIKLFEKLKKEI